jgi:hypothetical protein
MFRPFAVGEDGFIRQIGDTVEPGDRRHRRMRAGRDDKAPRADLDVARSNRAGVRETRLGTQYPDAEPFEPFHRIIRRDRRDDLVNAVHDSGEVDMCRGGVDAQRCASPHDLGKARGSEQRLRRYTTKIQAIAAHQPTFDEHDLGTHLGRPCGDRQTAGTGSDDAEIRSERPGHAAFLARQRLYPTGISARSANPTIGTSRLGLNRILRSGSSTTSPSPLPMLA